MPRPTSRGSGTLAVDHYCEHKGNEAANVLRAGMSLVTRSGQHTGAGELCVEVIARLRNDFTWKGVPTDAEQRAVGAAIDNLQSGFGHHHAQADHAGGNTCVQVLAGQLTT